MAEQRVSSASGAATDLGCSRAQLGMWFVEQAMPVASAHNLPLAIELSGTLDELLLRRAIDYVVAAHGTLRSKFSVDDGVLVRTELEPARWSSDLIEVVETDDIAGFVRDRSRSPVDLFEWPAFRVALARASRDRHALLFVFHHAVFDGTSKDVLCAELTALYAALAAGADPPNRPAVAPYASHVAEESAHVAALADRARAYWEPTLVAIDASARLPLRPSAEAGSGRHGEAVEFLVDGRLRERLEALARTEKASVFATVLAAVHVLLYRHAGLVDGTGITTAIALGTRSEETKDAIGLFVNEAPVLTPPSGDQTFREFLARTRDRLRSLAELRHFPFPEAAARYGSSRDPRDGPVQASIGYRRARPLPDTVPRLEVSYQRLLPHYGIRWPLGVQLLDDASWLIGRVDYDPAVMPAEIATALPARLQVLLDAVTEDPGRPIAKAPVLTERERRQILVEWNATEVEYPDDKSVGQVFERQVRRRPLATALVHDAGELSYSDVNDRANRLAHHLIDLGAEPETIVGLCLERGRDLAVSALAVLKAGGAYLPLDPDYPPERLAFMLEDTAAPLVVTSEALRESVPPSRARLVSVDGDAWEIARRPSLNPRPAITTDSLAYVMYTSGSTGGPKGVEVTHRGILRLVSNPSYGTLDQEQRILLHSPFAFDASTYELWGPLLNGGTCVVAAPGPLSLEALTGLVARHDVNTLFLTTALFNTVVDHAPEGLAGVRQLLTGGEAASPSHVRRGAASLPGATIVNCYGPTEATTFTTFYTVRAESPPTDAVPIGRPIQNTTTYLLDRAGEPVPIGVPGELYVGGPGVARGYLGRPELSSERFLADVAVAPGAVLYRTGDIGRYRPDGNIDFLCRVDNQVKIRGFRVEPGEIEATLREHALVRDAVVEAFEPVPGDKRLAAFVVLEGDGGAPDLASRLRALLRTRLPEHMIPSAFVRLEALPQTPSGKIDRRALPPVQLEPASTERVSPRTETEKQLAALWCDVLKLERVGVNEDFFELGGHSLLAAQLVTRARGRFENDLSVTMLFRHPTIEQLAVHADAPDRSLDDDLEPIRRAERRPLADVLPGRGAGRTVAEVSGGEIRWPPE
jgi:amino acid adenylation domain-containing protein